MRKELVLILIIVMGGALVVYNWSGSSPLPFRSTRGVVRTESTFGPPSEPPAKAVEGKTAHKAVHVDNKSQTAPDLTPARPPVAPSPQPAEPAPSHRDRPFPTPDALKTGAPSKELLATYGEPDFHVAGTSEGRVIEKYYYFNRDGSKLTLINAENGLLTSASSLPGSYFQLPGHGKPEPGRVSNKR
jgi:hypothetical protein